MVYKEHKAGGGVSEFELGRHYRSENIVETYKDRAAKLIQAHWKGYSQRTKYERILIEQFTA